MSRRRFQYDHANDPQFAEFKSEAGPSIPHSKLYTLWYETALVQELWSQGRTVKDARKLIGIVLLAHIRTPRQAHERTRALIAAWCRRRLPEIDLSEWLAKVFEPAIEAITPKFQKAVGNRNDRRRGRNRRLFQRRIKRGRPIAKDGLRARIAKHIKAEGQSSCLALAQSLALSPRTVESALTRMKADGQVVTLSRGVYVLPEPTEPPKLAKAHQRQIRENQALLEPPFEANIKAAEVREIGRNEAKAIIEKYEWLGSMPGFIVRCFGIFFDGVCGGVAIYSGMSLSQRLIRHRRSETQSLRRSVHITVCGHLFLDLSFC
ncbi:MAG TPA: hypothetical protein VFQ91_00660 [Bryobacteraceae bacterium]|nr:hypothetical protein [Bryobacteraceae bacterium]